MAILTAISASFVAIATLEVSFVDDYFAVGAYMQLEWGEAEESRYTCNRQQD